MNNDKGEMLEIAALWALRSGKGFQGKLGNSRLLVLANNKKSDKHPDYRVFVVKDEPRKKDAYAGQVDNFTPVTPTVARQENYGTGFSDEDIPF